MRKNLIFTFRNYSKSTFKRFHGLFCGINTNNFQLLNLQPTKIALLMTFNFNTIEIRWMQTVFNVTVFVFVDTFDIRNNRFHGAKWWFALNELNTVEWKVVKTNNSRSIIIIVCNRLPHLESRHSGHASANKI